MALIGMRYLNAVADGDTGRIDIGRDHILVRVNSRCADCDMRILRIDESGNVRCVGNFRTGSDGRAEAYVSGVCTCDTDVYMISTKENVLLYDRSVEENLAADAFRKLQSKERVKSDSVQEKQKDNEHAKTVEDKAVPQLTEQKQIPIQDAVDLLPDPEWPVEWEHWKAYFESPPQEIFLLPEPLGWKCVSAPARLAKREAACVLGRHGHGDAVDAMCIIVDGQYIPAQGYLPGFQYKKSPDGRGWWIRLEQKHKNA